MVCVYCGNATKVINSRHQKRANQVWRRRKCLVCEAVFTSTEAFDMGQAVVFKDNQHSKPFSRDTLLMSIYDSLRHRKSALQDATALTDTVLSKLWPHVTSASLQREDVVRITHEVLRRFDKAAATSYHAFHPPSAT